MRKDGLIYKDVKHGIEIYRGREKILWFLFHNDVLILADENSERVKARANEIINYINEEDENGN